MPIICWGNLAKAADDTQRIEQAIDEYIEGHNENPNAHMGENYALGAHRLQTVLDHSPYSIFNLHTYPQARSYKAIVDPTGNQDFTDIQAAIDYVHGLGGGAIFVKAGTYDLTDFIDLYDNIELIGEGPGLTILNFTVANKNVRVVGIGREPSWTSYTVLQNSKTVTGVDTDFLTSVEKGDYIRLDYCWYKIASVDSDTQLTLEETYRGPSLVDYEDPVICDFIENFKVSGFTIQGASGDSYITSSGFYMNLVGYFEIDNCLIKDNSMYGIVANYGNEGFFNRIVCADNGYSGIFNMEVVAAVYFKCVAFGNGENGFMLQSSFRLPAQVTDCLSYHNTEHGFLFNYSFYYSVKGCIAYGNKIDGFNLYGADYNQIIGCQSHHNVGRGINVSDADCHKNVILGNYLSSNNGGNFQDLGTNTEIGHNIIG